MPPPALLPVLTLPHPLILLPTARTQLSLEEDVGSKLIDLVQSSESQLVIGTVPCSPSSNLHSWGTLARIVRIVRPVARASQRLYHVTLHGLSRVHYPDIDHSESVSPNELVELHAEHPKSDGAPESTWVTPFRAAAAKLLENLAQDATQQSRRDVYVKISHMIEEVSDDRTPWMADVIVAGINKLDYNDKLGESLADILFLTFHICLWHAAVAEITQCLL